MSLQIIKNEKADKTTAKTKAKTKSDALVTAEAVDAYLAKKADYAKKAAKLEPLAKEIAELEAQFIAVADEALPADEQTVLVGTDPKTRIEVSAKGNQTKITDKQKLIELIGTEQYLEVATIGITDARKYLTEKQFNSVSVTERVTKRRLKVIED